MNRRGFFGRVLGAAAAAAAAPVAAKIADAEPREPVSIAPAAEDDSGCLVWVPTGSYYLPSTANHVFNNDVHWMSVVSVSSGSSVVFAPSNLPSAGWGDDE